MNEMFECNLPPYLAHDLEAWKKGVEEHSHLLDCLWGEGKTKIACACRDFTADR
jgi:hypothetical protein